MKAVLVIAVLLAAAAAAATSVEDGWGRLVAVEEPPQRIAALAPHLVETLFALGFGPRVVAAVAHTDYPPEAVSLPRVGDAFAVSFEALLAARPQLILAWGGTLTPERLQRLEAMGVPVYVSEPGSLADVAAELRRLGSWLGASAVERETALAVAEDFTARLARLDAGEPRRRVLPLISASPLLTLSRDHFVDDLLARCSAVNPLAAAAGPVIRLSQERLLTTELDLLLNLSAEPLPDGLRLPPGVRVATIDPDLVVRPGPRVIEGAEGLCALLVGEG